MPTASRYGGMGISYNIAIAVFGGTTPLIIQGLLELTGDELVPAYYLMATSVVGSVAVFCMRESSQRPLPGSMPSVGTIEEARELVENQDTNPRLDLSDMPFVDYEPGTGTTATPHARTPR